MSRRESRESAFKLLYQMEFQREEYDVQKELFIRELNVKDNELAYFNRIVEGVHDNRETLDSVYSKFLKNWNLDRIPKIDQTILRICTYEILNVPDVPHNVSISEAVYLAKKYSTDEARAYINGILGKLLHSKPAVLAPDADDGPDRPDVNDTPAVSEDPQTEPLPAATEPTTETEPLPAATEPAKEIDAVEVGGVEAAPAVRRRVRKKPVSGTGG